MSEPIAFFLLGMLSAAPLIASMTYELQKKRREVKALTVYIAQVQGHDDGELHVFELRLDEENEDK